MFLQIVHRTMIIVHLTFAKSYSTRNAAVSRQVIQPSGAGYCILIDGCCVLMRCYCALQLWTENSFTLSNIGDEKRWLCMEGTLLPGMSSASHTTLTGIAIDFAWNSFAYAMHRILTGYMKSWSVSMGVVLYGCQVSSWQEEDLLHLI